jgi:hypothetical protein
VRVVHGSLRAARTFRLMPESALAPITPQPPWSAGANTATCYRLPS